MNNSRRIGAFVALATAAVGMATVTATAPASAAPAKGPQPVSSWLGAVKANTSSWVKLYWRTDRPVCDVEVRVSGRELDVEYPGRKRFSSFNRSDTLRPGRTDFTPVQVTPDMNRPGVAQLRATVSYDFCGRRDRTQFKTFSLALPVMRNSHQGPNRPGDGRPGDDRPGNHNDRPGNNGNNDHSGWPTMRPSTGDDHSNRPTTGPSAGNDHSGRPTTRPTTGKDDRSSRFATPSASTSASATPVAAA